MGYKDPDQQRAYQLAWMKRRRGDWIAANGPCAKCGSWDRPEVDHVDRASKSMEPARIWSLSAAKRAAELAKCQVLCHDCHAEKTRVEAQSIPEHGTYARYSRPDVDRCRCALCRKAAAEYAMANRPRSAGRREPLRATPDELRLIAKARAALADGTAREKRSAMRVSQTDVAIALGVRIDSVWCWEAGRKTPNDRNALAYWLILAAENPAALKGESAVRRPRGNVPATGRAAPSSGEAHPCP